MSKLSGKNVFITGAEQGIGKATAERLIEAGCNIYVHYFIGDEGPKELCALAQSKGQKAKYGYVGASVINDLFIGEGINEAGLNAGLFYFPHYGSLTKYTPKISNRSIFISD